MKIIIEIMLLMILSSVFVLADNVILGSEPATTTHISSFNNIVKMKPIKQDGNGTYGEMWNYTSTGWTFDIDDSDIYYNLTGLVEGDLNGFTFSDDTQLNGGSRLIAEITGMYTSSADNIMVSPLVLFPPNNILLAFRLSVYIIISLALFSFSTIIPNDSPFSIFIIQVIPTFTTVILASSLE